MKKLLLIRHCQTQPFTEKSCNDPPLSEKGISEAEKIASHYKDEKIGLVLTSLFQRTQKTAEILNKYQKALIFSNSALNGFFVRDDGSGVEGTEEGLARSMGFLFQFRPYYDCIAVVGHDGILRTLLMDFLRIPFEDLGKYFKEPGESYMLRFDWAKGDKTWKIIDTFAPEKC